MARSKSTTFKGAAAGAFLRASMGKETTPVHELESVAIATHIAVKDGDMVSAVKLLETVKAAGAKGAASVMPVGWAADESGISSETNEHVALAADGRLLNVHDSQHDETIVDVEAVIYVLRKAGWPIGERVKL